MTASDAPTILLGVAVVGALVAAGVGRAGWRRMGAWMAATGCVGALVLLMVAFATEDWRLTYVVDHARPGLAWPLRVAGVWAGPEGSLLAWTTLMAIGLVVVAGRSTRRAGSVVAGAMVAGFTMVTMVAADPFARLATPPAGGLGLQPVLEHGAMTWHPPLLYAGLVAAATAGCLVLGRADIPTSRRWWLVAMALLTLGLVTGSRWAHVELGWGGYWAWDPVENVGLITWLLVAAAIHHRPSNGLAALTIASVVWGTTITRIGVVASVHAFADDEPLRLALLALAVGLTVLLVGTLFARAPLTGWSNRAMMPPSVSSMPSRWMPLVLVVMAVVVAIGTFEPAVESLVGGDAVAIGGRFYTVTLWPMVVIGLVVTLRTISWPGSFGSSVGILVTGLGAMAAVGVVGANAGVPAMVMAAGGGAMVMATVSSGMPRDPGGIGAAVAHVGIGLALVGIAATVGSDRATVSLAVDQPVTVAINGVAAGDGITVTHRGLDLVEGAVTTEAVAMVEVDGSIVHPRVVAHHTRSRTTSEMAEIHRWWSLVGTTQVVLIDGDADRAVYRIHHHPRIGLVWLGAGLIAAGSAIPLFAQQLVERRRRPLPTGPIGD